MRILALNGTYRSKKSTTQLTEAALEGAAAVGAETEMVMLCEHDIQMCRNCLSCYKDLDPVIPPCPIKDDMDEILDKVWDADGVILASPVHCGFVTGLMTVFLERTIWRMCRATTRVPLVGAFPAPRSSRVRAYAIIVSAGGVPHSLPKMVKRLDDTGTQWMKGNVGVMLNGRCTAELFAGACFPHKMRGKDWSKAYFLRELTDVQLSEARAVGKELAEVLKDGRAYPYDGLYDILTNMGLVGNFAADALTRLQRRRG